MHAAPVNSVRKFAFRLYLVFVASWFLHLTERVEVLGAMRVDLLMVVTIGALIVISRQYGPAKSESLVPKLIVGLAAYAIVTIPLVQWPGSVINTGLPNFIKAFVFYYFTVQLITTESQLKTLLIVFVAGQSFRVLEPLYLNLTQGYWGSFTTMMGDDGIEFMNRLSGSPYDVINANGLALVIITIIPFLHYLGPMTKLGGLFYMLYLPLGGYALMLTASRSGMLGLGMTVLLMWWNSRRKVLFGAIVAIAAAVAISQGSADLTDRYLSIFSSKTKNAKTAEGRLEGITQDFKVAMHRPYFGHGLGTSLEANANFGSEALVSHNLYTEVAQELGFIGLTIFLVFLITVARTVARTLKELRSSGHQSGLLLRLSLAVQAWLWMSILFSFASYGLSSYDWYFLAALSELLRRFSMKIPANPEPSPPGHH